MSGISSEDVAADFEDYLKDLQANNRYEISNLTIIAKENTEHAEAISRTLENHIKTVSRALQIHGKWHFADRTTDITLQKTAGAVCPR